MAHRDLKSQRGTREANCLGSRPHIHMFTILIAVLKANIDDMLSILILSCFSPLLYKTWNFPISSFLHYIQAEII